MMKILVIEDNDGMREEIVDILRFEGYEAREAENGRVGLEIVKAWGPDLVICDLMMPELDGYATLEAIRAHAPSAGTPFLCLTARGERRDMRKAMELGADDYLTKPFTAEELLAAVRAALAKGARTARDSAARLSDLMVQLSSALPHELRTPLNCILGYAELLGNDADAKPPEEVAEIAHRILGAGLRLNRITENFLLYAQLQLLGRGHGNPAALRLAEPLRADEIVAQTARLLGRNHGRDADLRLDLQPATVHVSEGYVAKIAAELIDNAMKYSPAGTPVCVTTGRTGTSVELVVADHGPGLTLEQLSSIGGDVQIAKLAQATGGLGLGLSIAERMAVLWGGQLRVESTPGQGTRVSVLLPADGPDATTGTARPSGERSTPR